MTAEQIAETDRLAAALPPRRRRAGQRLPAPIRRRLDARQAAAALRPLNWRSTEGIMRQCAPGYRTKITEQLSALRALPQGVALGTVDSLAMGDSRGPLKPYLAVPTTGGGVEFVEIVAVPFEAGRWQEGLSWFVATACGEAMLRGQTTVVWK